MNDINILFEHITENQLDYTLPVFAGKTSTIKKPLTLAFVDDDSGVEPRDRDEDLAEAKSSTERVRKYYKRHPEKVRKYLRDTVKDRAARNRDRKKAIKKHGKTKMKNHDVHHPNGAQNGNWRLAKKDHGRDKKNENVYGESIYVTLDDVLTGNVPNEAWTLISEKKFPNHDFVICEECKGKFTQIQYRHLKYKHNMTMEEYTKKYPSAKLIAENAKNYMGSGKNPMENEENRQKISKALAGTHKCAHFGDKNPMKRLENRQKFMGENNPAKRQDVKKKISERVATSYTDELKKVRSEQFTKIRNSDEYKERMYQLNLWTRPENKTKKELYESLVRSFSNENYQKYFNEIPNAKKRSREWHLDHKVSIQYGFNNNIHPLIISHPCNLEVIHHTLNESKGPKTSILYEDLIQNIKQFDHRFGEKTLLVCGGAAGHMAHPYEDDELTFRDVKEMIHRGLVGQLDQEGPVTEKLDGQNIAFTIKDGVIRFARNKSHVKNAAQNSLDVAGIRSMFAGRGNIERAFTGAAEDLQTAVERLTPAQQLKLFGNGSKFMNVEVIFPDTKNVIPYDKAVLVFHGTIEYNEDGTEKRRSIDDANTLATALTAVNADRQRTFGISGPRTIVFDDTETAKNKRKLQQYIRRIRRLQQEYGLDDDNTIDDYKREWWSRAIDQMGFDLSDEERDGLISRWAAGDKSFRITDVEDLKVRKKLKNFEQNDLPGIQRRVGRVLEHTFLQVGVDAMRRVVNFLAANNPQAAQQLKQEVLTTIEDLRQTDDRNKLARLQQQIERLEALGVDNIVPSEGLVFIYNGKPYKFTGTFAPVNQILGTLKFERGEATLVEPPTKPEPTTTSDIPSEPVPSAPGRTVAIFAGRFQPFHAGHYSIYQALVDKFGKDNVYIVSSNKTDATRSPFEFRQKKQVMTRMFDIPEEMIVQVKNPYAPEEVLRKLPANTTYVTAVSQKDAERLGQRGGYFRPYDETDDHAGFEDQGYYIVAPEMQLSVNGKNISGTQLRAVLGDPNITDRAKKQIFTQVYRKFDQKIFDLVVKKTTESEEALKLTAQYGSERPSKKTRTPAKIDTKQRKRAQDALRQRITNPKTKRKIYVATALAYPKNHPLRKTAEQMLQRALKRESSIITENKIK